MDATAPGFQVVLETLRAWSPAPEERCQIEAVEDAIVDGAKGLVLLWSQFTVDQRVRAFGLVATDEEVMRLAATNAGHFLLSDLHLMLVEPHGAAGDESTRTWFRPVDGFIA